MISIVEEREYSVVYIRRRKTGIYMPKKPLVGDATKARNLLGWTHTVSFRELVRETVENDLALNRGATLP